MAPRAEIRYRDQQFAFPAVDDVEDLKPDRVSDLRRAFSTGGVPETFHILPYETVQFGVPDVVEDATISELEAFWSHARRGFPFSFAFDNTDRVLTALEEDIPAGSAYLWLSSIEGIKVGGKYLLMQDILGRNTSQNLLSADQSRCEAASAYTLTGSMIADLVTAPRVVAGNVMVRLYSPSNPAGSGIAASVPAISGEKHLTFSVWYSGATPGGWRMFIDADGAITTSIILPSPPAILGAIKRMSVTAFLPEGATTISVGLRTTIPGALWITLDAWQVALKQHATPWVIGDGLKEFSAATDAFHEIVEVKRTGFKREGASTWIELIAPTKFPYRRRDAIRSRYYWERLIALGARSPLGLKMLTSEFRQTCREIP